MRLTVVTILCLFSGVTETRIFQRCFLAKFIRAEGLEPAQQYSVGDWLCMVHYGSKFNSRYRGKSYSGLSLYGIFQLNSYFHCSTGCGRTFNICGSPCRMFINFNIKDDFRCAKLIAENFGMEAWDSWKDHCKDTDVTQWTKGCPTAG